MSQGYPSHNPLNKPECDKHDDQPGLFQTTMIVPPELSQGDQMMPIHFSMFNKEFDLLGKYNEEKDVIQFTLTGEPGTRFKMSVSDGNSPYGWKVKSHGITRPDDDEGMASVLLDILHLSNNNEESFQQKDTLVVPFTMMKTAGDRGELDSKKDCVVAWSFYGSSLPEKFLRCQIKIKIMPEEEEMKTIEDENLK